VRVERTSAGRGGKTVTIVRGIEGGEKILAELARALKTRCGAGGTVREETVEIQGDQVARVLGHLSAQGYRPKRSGG
jgi:translation initiation factor 1